MWIPLLIAAIEAAKKYYDDRKTEKWQQSVSDKLDLIIVQLTDIHKQLELLPGVIFENVQEALRRQQTSDLKAHLLNINDLININPNGPKSVDDQNRWINTLEEVKTLIEINMDYQNWGFGQFAVVASGIAAASGLATFSKNKLLFKSLVEHGVDYFKAAIDPKIAGSFGAAYSQVAQSEATALTETKDLFNTWFSTGRSESDGTGSHEPNLVRGHIYTVFMIVGALDTGVGETRLEDHTQPAPKFPGTSGNGDHREDEARAILVSKATEFQQFVIKASNSQNCIDVCKKIIFSLESMN